ncbi:MAG: hypothetical protein JJU37_17090 [Balneolaceae bacterium]|nr:hypothetical protein [Balneolaceae bacterium]
MSDVQEKSSIISDEEKDQDSFQLIEIDLVEKAELIWSERKLIIIISTLFFLLGLFHYSFAPSEYESTSMLIHEIESTGNFDGGGALLRSLTGMNIPSSSGNLSAAATGRAPLPVSLYPLIINSTDFQKDLILRELEFSTLDTNMTLYSYFNNHYQSPLRGRVYSYILDMSIYLPYNIYRAIRRNINSIRNSKRSESNSTESSEESIQVVEVIDERLLSVSNSERRVIENMRNRITLNIGGSTTEIITKLPDPKAAALVNAILVERIQDYMTEYRIEKAQQNLNAVIRQYNEARERYEDANQELARFQDENINLSTATARIHEEHLRNQRNLRFSVYNSISQEVEQARMVLEQQIPVFNVLEKPNIPNSASGGSSDLILVFSIVIGLFSGVGWVLVKNSKMFDRSLSNQ